MEALNIHPLRRWRKAQPSPANPGKRMSQDELGALIGVGPSQISQIEKGLRGCSVATAIRIRDLAGDDVPLESLIAESAQ